MPKHFTFRKGQRLEREKRTFLTWVAYCLVGLVFVIIAAVVAWIAAGLGLSGFWALGTGAAVSVVILVLVRTQTERRNWRRRHNL
jgi:membrane protein YdbS with pleckstrin-like domain